MVYLSRSLYRIFCLIFKLKFALFQFLQKLEWNESNTEQETKQKKKTK